LSVWVGLEKIFLTSPVAVVLIGSFSHSKTEEFRIFLAATDNIARKRNAENNLVSFIYLNIYRFI
jgi:hypothetical protein